MSIHDKVIAPCPKCGRDVVFQSIERDGQWNSYLAASVPPELASHLDGKGAECGGCGTELQILLPDPPDRVQMVVEEAWP
jgi:hypothetical protein